MHKHYANRPYSADVVTVEGLMKIEVYFFAKLLRPLFMIAGALVPYAGDNVPVTVHFRSEKNSDAYCFDRIFYFPDKKPYHFRSKMHPVGGNEVVELMPINLGWHTSYSYDGQKIIMEHRGYKIKILGKLFRLPLEFLMGKTNAWEQAKDTDNFYMYMDMRHIIFGKIYSYSGEFKIKEVLLNE